MSTAVFNKMMSEVDDFSYEQCVAMLGKITESLQKRRPLRAEEKNPLEKFAGLVNDEDSKKMAEAVTECRKTEGADEW